MYGFKNEFIQAFMNIISNSKDAFSIQKINNEDKLIFITLKQDNNNIIITIKDNAGGIPKNIVAKVFEPYFTTKHKSQGTGIGLYMTHEIVTKHMNGYLKVENENLIYNNNEYVGAKFTIMFKLDDK